MNALEWAVTTDLSSVLMWRTITSGVTVYVHSSQIIREY